ncbi:MAG: LON peptidase substrate-binding domain-containing protein [Alphaproteobacteria bacterium]
MSVFDPALDDLPATLPIFPLSGVLLLPRNQLPLNIFEPRYLAMVDHALAGGRMIGMVQPRNPEADDPPPVYPVGCAGRIVQFEETEEGRYLISLKGLIRFTIAREMPVDEENGFRLVQPDWTGFGEDLSPEEEDELDRSRLLASLKTYFKQQEIEANWEAITGSPAERLINSLSMVCPFESSEKQALLEAPTVVDRLDVLTSLVEMAVMETSHGDGRPQ